jgi:flagellar biosynthesis/type III secretory pathway protein FliH
MMRSKMQILLLLIMASLLIVSPTLGDDMFIYPNKGQTKQQQDKDKYECYDWAKQQTGFDPMAQPKATAPPPAQEAKQGGVVRGAARGALVGVAVGAIAGDAGKGAAIGAAGGGLFGGMRRRDQQSREEAEQEQWANQQAANYEQNRSKYNRAFSSCMEGRGYTVK